MRRGGVAARPRSARWRWPALALAVAVGSGFGCQQTSTPPPMPPNVGTTHTDELGPGDLIEIRVADQEELTGEYEVGDDGTIRFPWIGDVEIAGRSKGEIAEDIESRLAPDWLRHPQVTVRVMERQNREVSVLGQVNEPGSFAFKERLTLVQAISLAGGMNPLAQAKKVQLTRETPEGPKTYVIDVRQILESKQPDFPLLPGDIVFVPESPI